jgi:hypothetical protein
MIRDVRRVVARTVNQIQTGRPTQEFNYSGTFGTWQNKNAPQHTNTQARTDAG